MREYRSVFLLVLIMVCITLAVGGTAILILYETAVAQERTRLAEYARGQALLVDAIVQHELALGVPSEMARLNAVRQIAAAHRDAPGRPPRTRRADTGELNLAQREGDDIVYLIRRGQALDGPPFRVRYDAGDAGPMRRALSGESGSATGIGYLGATVLAAYEPLPKLGLGIVTKVDMATLRAPFRVAGMAVLALALVMIALGSTLFFQVSTPMIEHIRSSDRRFRDLFDRMSSGVAVFEAIGDADDFVITDLNPAGERIDKIDRKAVVGRPVGEVLPGVEASGLLAALARVWRSGEPEHIPARLYEDERIHSWRESFVYRLPGGEVVELFDDVTERKATEEQLRQAQKMEVVGQLTGGVAHDFNNLLAIILGNLQLLRERTDRDQVARELIADALWSAERGAELTHRLLAFARRQPLNPVVTDVNALIVEMLELVRRTFGGGPCGEVIVVEERLDPALWRAAIDRGQLESALMNLIVNARDAMPSGGALRLETRNVTVAGDAAPANPGQGPDAGAYIMVGVSDTGVGIAGDVIGHIFEPFFTTKRQGEGSGLGLSMVYGFVKQSGGHVEIDSAPGRGTEVRLYLPPAEARPGRGERDGAVLAAG